MQGSWRWTEKAPGPGPVTSCSLSAHLELILSLRAETWSLELLVRMALHVQGAWCSVCYLSDYRTIQEWEDGNATSTPQGTLRQVETYIVCMLSRFSCVQLFVTLWIVAHQVPLSMGFSRQDYWNALPCCPPTDLPNPRIKCKSYVSCVGRQVLYH